MVLTIHIYSLSSFLFVFLLHTNNNPVSINQIKTLLLLYVYYVDCIVAKHEKSNHSRQKQHSFFIEFEICLT